MVTIARLGGRRRRKARTGGSAYTLVARGPDGRPRSESFTTAARYRSRIETLGADDRPVSFDDIVDLLMQGASQKFEV